jgi:hypothetical protein
MKPVVLAETHWWPGLPVLLGVIAALTVPMVIFQFYPFWLLSLLTAALITAVIRRGYAVLADEAGLLIRRRQKLKRSYAWAEIDRMGWVDTGFWGSSLMVYPRGGPYDVPGPNAATRVGGVWRPGRRRSGTDPLPELLQVHGIKSLTDS